MATTKTAFNLSGTIREYRETNPGASLRDFMAWMKSVHTGKRINEGTLKSTWFRLDPGKSGNGVGTRHTPTNRIAGLLPKRKKTAVKAMRTVMTDPAIASAGVFTHDQIRAGVKLLNLIEPGQAIELIKSLATE